MGGHAQEDVPFVLDQAVHQGGVVDLTLAQGAPLELAPRAVENVYILQVQPVEMGAHAFETCPGHLSLAGEHAIGSISTGGSKVA